MKKHSKAHVRPLSCIPQKAQMPLQIKLDTVTQAIDVLMLLHRQSPWKTVPWYGGNGDDNNNDNGVIDNG